MRSPQEPSLSTTLSHALVRAKAELDERARLATLFAGVSIALASTSSLDVCLQRCAEVVREQLGASLVRVWMLGDGKAALGVAASAGVVEGPHGADIAVALSSPDIARVADERKPFVRICPELALCACGQLDCNDLSAFTAHPLLVEAKLVGVLGLFSKEVLTDAARSALTSVSDTIAIGIQRKLLEKEQSELQAQFLQAQKMEAIGQLSGAIAHDFNNLLAVILSCSALLLDELPDTDPRRRDVLDIQHAGDRAASLTRQLLAFSRKLVIEPRIVQINDVIRDVQKMLSRLIGEDIELSIQLDAVDSHVKADPGLLEQLVMNLAVNARDAMPSGGRLALSTSTIYLDAAPPNRPVPPKGPYVLISVADTGCGMDSATQARIFEPFFTTKPAGKGTGLGLSTVYGIVEQSGGFIQVESTPGAGTSFRVFLPCCCAESDYLVRGASDAGRARPGETILLVEDEPGVRALAARILRARGYEVLETSDPESALEALEQSQISVHLLLSDMVMPGGNGPDLAAAVRARLAGLRVLFMSGHTDHPTVLSGQLGNGTGFLHKPFTPETLATKVRELLDA
ncbi:MAG: ATP-binding protein [Myxococcota bacterium]